jgi:large subunit ribosomal protein L22
MQATARHKFARVSPTKVRPMARLIQAMPLQQALDTLRVSNQRSARLLEKIVKSAWANAIETGGRIDEGDFVVTSARVDAGPTIRRIRPGDRGRVRPIRKRSCHITVVISDGSDDGVTDAEE